MWKPGQVYFIASIGIHSVSHVWKLHLCFDFNSFVLQSWTLQIQPFNRIRGHSQVGTEEKDQKTARNRRHGDFFFYSFSGEQILSYLTENKMLLISSRHFKQEVKISGSPLGHVSSPLVWRSSGRRGVQASGLLKQKFWQLEEFLLISMVLQCFPNNTLNQLKKRQIGYQMLIKPRHLTSISDSTVYLAWSPETSRIGSSTRIGACELMRYWTALAEQSQAIFWQSGRLWSCIIWKTGNEKDISERGFPQRREILKGVGGRFFKGYLS